MAYDGETGRQPPAASGLATAVQANLGRASRFVDGKTRNWSLFLFQAIEDFSKGAFARLPASFTTPIKADVARAAYVTLSNPDNFNGFVAKFGNTPAAAGRKALSGGLLGAFAYELFRQFAPAQARPKDGVVRPAVLRSEAVETGLKRDRDQSEKQWDPVPINFA